MVLVWIAFLATAVLALPYAALPAARTAAILSRNEARRAMRLARLPAAAVGLRPAALGAAALGAAAALAGAAFLALGFTATRPALAFLTYAATAALGSLPAFRATRAVRFLPASRRSLGVMVLRAALALAEVFALVARYVFLLAAFSAGVRRAFFLTTPTVTPPTFTTFLTAAVPLRAAAAFLAAGRLAAGAAFLAAGFAAVLRTVRAIMFS